jgi:hypothetical protein
MIVVFVNEVSERLVYTFDFIFKDREIAYQITNDPVYFEVLEGFKFNYSNNHFNSGLQIPPSQLLFSEEISEYQINKALFFQEECLSFDGVIDPIASVFYILSRYEEYLTEKRDEHERFRAEDSLQYRYGWLDLCICDRWCEDLISFMEKEYQKPIANKEIAMRFIPSFDIDNVRAYEWKEGLRTWIGTLKDRWKKNKEALQIREDVKNKKQKDPYDTFEEIVGLTFNKIEPIVFWLIGDFAKYDRNVSVSDKRHRTLIQDVASNIKVGIHPSYKSNYSTFYLEKEVERMEEILEQEVFYSRQHYLKVNLPYTYRNLVNVKIKHDYSMGYASLTGFRAGTARPFRFFDLPKNTITELVVHSFCYMDATFLDYLNYSIEESKVVVRKLYQEVETYGGEFIPLWHNESISDYGRWKNWKDLFDFTIRLHTVKI